MDGRSSCDSKAVHPDDSHPNMDSKQPAKVAARKNSVKQDFPHFENLWEAKNWCWKDWDEFFEMWILSCRRVDTYTTNIELEGKKQCKPCGGDVDFSSLLGVKLHVMQKHPRKCWICGHEGVSVRKKSPSSGEWLITLNDHYRMEHGFDLLYRQIWLVRNDVKKFPCPHCRKWFKDETKLYDHLLKYHPQNCPLCFSRVRNQKAVQNHILVHHGKRFIGLTQRNVSSEVIQAAKRSLAEPGEPNETWNCPVCWAEFSRHAEVQSHLATNHKSSDNMQETPQKQTNIKAEKLMHDEDAMAIGCKSFQTSTTCAGQDYGGQTDDLTSNSGRQEEETGSLDNVNGSLNLDRRESEQSPDPLNVKPPTLFAFKNFEQPIKSGNNNYSLNESDLHIDKEKNGLNMQDEKLKTNEPTNYIPMTDSLQCKTCGIIFQNTESYKLHQIGLGECVTYVCGICNKSSICECNHLEHLLTHQHNQSKTMVGFMARLEVFQGSHFSEICCLVCEGGFGYDIDKFNQHHIWNDGHIVGCKKVRKIITEMVTITDEQAYPKQEFDTDWAKQKAHSKKLNESISRVEAWAVEQPFEEVQPASSYIGDDCAIERAYPKKQFESIRHEENWAMETDEATEQTSNNFSVQGNQNLIDHALATTIPDIRKDESQIMEETYLTTDQVDNMEEETESGICQKMDDDFSKSDYMITQMLTEIEDQHYTRCPVCNVRFENTLSARKKHHQTEHPMVCYICSEEFEYAQMRRLHMADKHTVGQARYKVTITQENVNTNPFFESEIRKRKTENKENRKYCCKVCMLEPKRFSTQSSLNLHVGAKHPKICPFCWRWFKTKPEFLEHKEYVHNDKKIFMNPEELEVHKKKMMEAACQIWEMRKNCIKYKENYSRMCPKEFKKWFKS